MKEKALKVNEFSEIEENGSPPPALLDPLTLLNIQVARIFFLWLDYFFRISSWGVITGPRGQNPFNGS